MNNNIGFTLVETLVVIALFVIVGGISVNLLFSAMKSSTKSAMMNQIKQNGDYALAVMERTIRNGKSITPCPGTTQDITIQNVDDTTTTFDINLGSKQITKDTVPLTSSELEFVGFNNNFDCTQTSGKPANVKITFTLSPRTGTWTSADPAPSMSFQTSITLRNY